MWRLVVDDQSFRINGRLGTRRAARECTAVEIGADDLQPEAQQEVLANATGVRLTHPATATWEDNLYACRYVYGTNVMVVSVKELANKTETDAYVASLERQLGVTRNVPIGPRAFLARNGSVVVQKDYKVLLVDVRDLPQKFGEPLDTRENITLNVATSIMGCWTGE